MLRSAFLTIAFVIASFVASRAAVSQDQFAGQWSGSFTGTCRTCASKELRQTATFTFRRDESGRFVGEVDASGKKYPIIVASIDGDTLSFRYLTKGGLSGVSSVANGFTLKLTGNVLEGPASVSVADTGAQWDGKGKFSKVSVIGTAAPSMSASCTGSNRNIAAIGSWSGNFSGKGPGTLPSFNAPAKLNIECKDGRLAGELIYLMAGGERKPSLVIEDRSSTLFMVAQETTGGGPQGDRPMKRTFTLNQEGGELKGLAETQVGNLTWNGEARFSR